MFIRLCSGPGRVTAESSGLLFYDADTKPGASGGPVLGLGSCAPCVLAIHAKSKHGGSGSHGRWNHGPVVSRKVFANLRAWRRAK